MDLGDRMKQYEASVGPMLIRRCPAILRVDGRAFHTLTRGFEKPYDQMLASCMRAAAMALCEEISSAKIAYGQSDEVSVLMTDYDTLGTEQWFGGRVQKMASIAAATASLAFNAELCRIQQEIDAKIRALTCSDSDCEPQCTIEMGRIRLLEKKLNRSVFDARVFNVPVDDVANYFVWRQRDAVRNSIQGLGQKHLSHSRLQKKDRNEVQDMLFKECGINWNDVPVRQKRGYAAYKTVSETPFVPAWIIDQDIPIFTQDRRFIERWLDTQDES